jgi:tRNA1(Val) A37 N6-methylase TrmN6
MSLDDASNFVKQQTLTRDAFLGGRLNVSQPQHGFRAGLDSVLLGAAVSEKSRSLLDFGAGAGTAALVALAHHPALTATLVDDDPQMTALAAANLVDNGFAARARTLTLDVTAPGKARAAAGLASDHFQTVIANPPFFDPARGTAPSDDRAAARHMAPDDLERWIKAAATHCAPEGEAIFIHAAPALPTLLAGFEARFGAITLLPITPRDNVPATRVLVRGIKGSRAPLALLASRVLHEGEGRGFRPEFEAIFRGEARLIW